MARRKFISDVLTGRDNLTFDAARVVGVLGAFSYVGFWCAAVFGFGRFTGADAAAYGAGFAAVLIAMAGAVKIKETAEPSSAASSRRKA